MGDRSALALAESSQWGLLYQMIISHPERAEECDDFGMMPLHWACTVQDVQPRVVRKLVDAYPLAVMLKNKGGLIPLHIAIKAKVPLEVLQVLVTKNDSAVCEETPSGETPAELAEEHGLSRDAVEYLNSVEDELRRSGRMPPRPARFRPLSKHASLRGFGTEPLSGDHDSKRQEMSSLRARGFGVKGGASMPHMLPPRWNLDRKCNICQIKFTYFKTRHHCRNCGVSVCSTHSSRRLPLQHIGLDTPQRVCIMCHDELRENGKPPSAVANLYSKKTTLRAPFGDITNNNTQHNGGGQRSSLTHSQGTTQLDSSFSSQRSGYAYEGAEFHDSDVEDENLPKPSRPRPRAQTGMEGADRISAMKDQVKELEAHMRELREQKERMQVAIDESNHKAQHAVKDKHNQEVAIADARGDRIIDVFRVTMDADLEKNVLGVDYAVAMDDAAANPEELEMPDDGTLDIAATCHYLGLAYLEKGEFENAITELRKSVSLYRRDPDVWYNLARALQAMDEPFEAEIAVQRSLDLHPKNYTALSLLGKILHARGDHDRSIEIFQRALGLMTTNSDSGDEEDVGSMTVGW